MPKQKPSGDLAGTFVADPKGHGEKLLFPPLRKLLIAAINCIFNFKLKFKFTDAEGNVIAIQDCEVKCSPLGMTVMTPPLRIPPQNGQGDLLTAFHPFKLYQPTNFRDFETGITFLGNDGEATICNIDSTVPTDFSSDPPTVNPYTDAWRFWAVRSGECEVRPLYTKIWSAGEVISANGGILRDPYNFGYKYAGIQYADGHESFDAPLGSFDDPSLATINPPLIIGGARQSYDPAHGQFSGIWWGVWLKIIPDTAIGELPQIQLAARTWYSNTSADRAFPDTSQNTIPIAVLYPIFQGDNNTGTYTTNFNIDQKIFDHVRNRFEPGAGNFGGGGSTNLRGIYDKDNNLFQPGDLADQIFYRNDVVIVKYGDQGRPRVAQCMFIDNEPAHWENPVNSTRWTTLFDVLVA